MAYDRTLIQIRERSFLDLLDLALTVIRRRPLPLVAAAVAGIAPFVVFNAWVMSRDEVAPFAWVWLIILEAPWATAPLTLMIGGLMFGERPTIGRMVRTLFVSLPGMFCFQLLVRSTLMIFLVFYPLVPARLGFLNEVILLERGRWWAAVRRSSLLCGQRGGEFFGQWLAQLFFGGLFALSFLLGTEALFTSLTRSDLTWEQPTFSDFMSLRFQLAIWVAIAFFAVARFLTYIDQRIRIEGWELELRLRAEGQALEDSGRW